MRDFGRPPILFAYTPAQPVSLVFERKGKDRIESSSVQDAFVAKSGPLQNHASETGAFFAKSKREQSNEALDPKLLKILPGDAHAQHIFKTDQGDVTTKLILDCLTE